MKKIDPKQFDDIYQFGMMLDKFNILTPFGRLCYIGAKLQLGHADAFRFFQQSIQNETLIKTLKAEIGKWTETYRYREIQEPHDFFVNLSSAMHSIESHPELVDLLFAIKAGFLQEAKVQGFIQTESNFGLVEKLCQEYSHVQGADQLGHLFDTLLKQMNAVRDSGKLLPANPPLGHTWV